MPCQLRGPGHHLLIAHQYTAAAAHGRRLWKFIQRTDPKTGITASRRPSRVQETWLSWGCSGHEYSAKTSIHPTVEEFDHL
jgi:hypothetical protein